MVSLLLLSLIQIPLLYSQIPPGLDLVRVNASLGFLIMIRISQRALRGVKKNILSRRLRFHLTCILTLAIPMMDQLIMDSNIEIIMLIYHTRTVKVVLFICTRVVYGILSKVLSRYFRTKVLYYINLQRYSMKVRKYGTKVYFRTKVRKYFRTYLATTFVLYLFRTKYLRR